MSSISQSVAWWCFVPEKLNPPEFVRAVAETGYAAIDLVPPAYYELVAAHGFVRIEFLCDPDGDARGVCGRFAG